MTGILLVDKPSGPTSHDVVATVRRVTAERAVGHTGTLDPTATGLLLLVLGRATRLAALLTGGDKTYAATIRLGFATDTDDVTGTPIPGNGPGGSPLPGDAALAAAIADFRGTYEQVPPSHSAKHVAGRRAYDLARRDEAVALKPAAVTVRELTMTGRDAALVHLHVVATAGFYVRALARDVGRRLGCGAHLTALRRMRSGGFDVADAVPLGELAALGPALEERLIPPAAALPQLPAVHLTVAGLKRAAHGNPVGPEHLAERWVPPATTSLKVRLLDPDSGLVALADARGGLLHPVVVLGYH